MTLLNSFQPAQGFVEAARADVERSLEADAQAVSRQALAMAAAGNHEAAVERLEAYEPSHPVILSTLDELLANPSCPDELPRVRQALLTLRMGPGVAQPQALQVCDGPFQIEIQNEQVRFGARCARASATAFVPVFCERGSAWTEPYLLRFFLTASADGWQIDDAVEIVNTP